MTALETLQKYGLKTDVKSIKYRVEMDSYFAEILPVLHIPSNEMLCDVGWGKLNHARNICRSADLTLLCSLAEKGERRSNPLNPNIKMTVQEAWAQVSDEAEPYVIYECLDTISKAIEKGERYEKAVKKELENAQSFIKFDGQKGQASAIEYLLKAIITEAEGK